MGITKLTQQAFLESDVWCLNEGYDGYEVADTKDGIIISPGGDKFIRAKISLKNGDSFDGYIIDGFIKVMEIVCFLPDKEKVRIHSIFNKSQFLTCIEKFQNSFNLNIKDIFPIKYETDYRYEEKDRIEGFFTISTIDKCK